MAPQGHCPYDLGNRPHNNTRLLDVAPQNTKRQHPHLSRASFSFHQEQQTIRGRKQIIR